MALTLEVALEVLEGALREPGAVVSGEPGLAWKPEERGRDVHRDVLVLTVERAGDDVGVLSEDRIEGSR
jgi:hypothetical protein